METFLSAALAGHTETLREPQPVKVPRMTKVTLHHAVLFNMCSQSFNYRPQFLLNLSFSHYFLSFTQSGLKIKDYLFIMFQSFILSFSATHTEKMQVFHSVQLLL